MRWLSDGHALTSIRTTKLLLAGPVFTILTLVAPVCQAVPLLVTSRGDLAANDFVDWGVLGPPITVLPSTFSVASHHGGTTMTVTNPAGGFQRRDECAICGWVGNFAPGDALLWAPGLTSAIDIRYGSPVFGAGAQIQTNAVGAFTATLDAYDVLDNLLASVSLGGTSTTGEDNTAPFLGVLDTTPSISRIRYSAVPPPSSATGFALNQLDIATVPEPSTLLLLAAGLFAVSLLPRVSPAAGRPRAGGA